MNRSHEKIEQYELGEVCETSSGGTPSRDIAKYWSDGTIPWVKSGEVAQGEIWSTEEHISVEGLKNSSAKLFPKETVLLAMYGATIGQAGILKIEASTNQAICGIIPSERISQEYLLQWLKAKKRYIVSLGAGGAQPNISQSIIRKLLIPIPSLSEQKRIAAILDAADSIRTMRKAAIAKLDQLAQSLFLEMFGDPVKNEKGWPKGTLRNLATAVNYGTSKPSQEKGKYPYLRMNNITYSGELDLSDLKYIDATKDELLKYSPNKGDLLFNRTNSKELVGKTTVFNVEQDVVIAGYIIRVQTAHIATSMYISQFLNSRWGKAILKNMCKSIIGMANINAQELQDIPMLLPPQAVKERFYSYIEGIGCLREIHKEALAREEALFSSLQDSAFSGRL